MTLSQIIETIRSEWSKALWDCNTGYEGAEGVIAVMESGIACMENPDDATFEISCHGHISVNGEEFAYCLDPYACPPDNERFIFLS